MNEEEYVSRRKEFVFNSANTKINPHWTNLRNIPTGMINVINRDIGFKKKCKHCECI